MVMLVHVVGDADEAAEVDIQVANGLSALSTYLISSWCRPCQEGC